MTVLDQFDLEAMQTVAKQEITKLQVKLERLERDFKASVEENKHLEDVIRSLNNQLEFERRKHAEALDDAKSPCHGLGCGQCEECIQARARRGP